MVWFNIDLEHASHLLNTLCYQLLVDEDFATLHDAYNRGVNCITPILINIFNHLLFLINRWQRNLYHCKTFRDKKNPWTGGERREKEACTLILLILSVNLALNSKESVEAIVLVFGDFTRILYLAHESECRSLITSSSPRFNWFMISV